MIRLHVTAEGQTEQAFVKIVLAPHLALHDAFADARCVLTSKDKRAAEEYRGGLLKYKKAKADIQTWMKEDKRPECRFTTMFDLYALPVDFPGYAEAKRNPDPYKRVALLEDDLAQDEFEALILADPVKLDWEYLEHDTPIQNLVAMVGEQNPELINDGPETAPSKRIIKEIPEYDKVSGGVSVSEKIGLPILREKCCHFGEWLTGLEKLGTLK